jgi:leucyl-tRNA synthetase
MFEMFMGPLEDMKPWNTKGIVGIKRFLEKVFALASKAQTNAALTQTNAETSRLLHKTIKKVTEDIENFRFNTAIAALMILTNELEKQKELRIADYALLITVLSPFAPHLAEELWEQLGHKESVFLQTWPQYDSELIKDETVKMVVQVNGKLRDTLEVSAEITEAEVKELVIKSEKVKKFIDDQEIKKVIFVKGKLINLVI